MRDWFICCKLLMMLWTDLWQNIFVLLFKFYRHWPLMSQQSLVNYRHQRTDLMLHGWPQLLMKLYGDEFHAWCFIVKYKRFGQTTWSKKKKWWFILQIGWILGDWDTFCHCDDLEKVSQLTWIHPIPNNKSTSTFICCHSLSANLLEIWNEN